MSKRQKRKLFKEQRVMGLILTLGSVAMVTMASHGVIDSDCTAALFFMPLGVWMYLSKKLLIAF